VLLDAFVLEHVGETLHRYHRRLFSGCGIKKLSVLWYFSVVVSERRTIQGEEN
jgi:hypothetical protein